MMNAFRGRKAVDTSSTPPRPAPATAAPSPPAVNGLARNKQGGSGSSAGGSSVGSSRRRKGTNTTTNQTTAGRASRYLDPRDPVTMHLLMETAMGESRHYEILTLEEAERMRQELPVLANKIEAVKRQLAIESRVRDASSSLSRLDRAGGEGQANAAVAAARQKCDALSVDLAQLEKKHQDTQVRLLEHTAGVLQMTHKGSMDRDASNHVDGGLDGAGGTVNGIAGGDHLDLHHFDDRSFYQALDSMLDEGQAGGLPRGGAAGYQQQTEAILEIERKMYGLNRQLRDAVAKANAEVAAMPEPPQPGTSAKLATGRSKDGDQVDAALQQQLTYLEKSVQNLQNTHADGTRYEDTMRELWQDMADGERFSVDGFKMKVSSLSTRVSNLTNQKEILNRQIQQQREINNKSDGAKDAKSADLQQKVQTLQQELSETIAEYEVMTKSSIEFEKERENLEVTIDGLRDKCDNLESQLSEERVSKLGIKSPVSPEDKEKGATSTSVLKNEFKKMMRETRAENMKALKHEQEERRKLEAQIRELKRGQSSAKSPLNKSVTAT